MTSRTAPRAEPTTSTRHLLWPGVAIGVGLAGTLDEIVFHQLLHWHHFYDRSTRAAGLVSDGILHIASTALLVAGVYLALGALWRDRSGADPARMGRLWAGVLLGLGGFNLYDGTIQHKVLRLHQVRPAADDPLPYDIAWIGVALTLVVAGLLLLRRRVAPARAAARG